MRVPETHMVERGVRFIPHLTGCCFARSRVARTLSAIGWYSGLVESDGSAVRGRADLWRLDASRLSLTSALTDSRALTPQTVLKNDSKCRCVVKGRG